MTEYKYENISDRIRIAEDPRGLILTTDACLLAAFVGRNSKQRICELGAGSGIISAMLIDEKKIMDSVCVDNNSEICDVALKNARENGIYDRMKTVCADVTDFVYHRKFDAVVSNPPYFRSNDGKENSRKEDKFTRHETTAGINEFALCAGRILKDGGIAYFCYTPMRLPELICALHLAGLETKNIITVYPTIRHRPSLVLVSAKKGASAGAVMHRPLIIFKDKPGGEYTDDFLYIKQNNRIEL